MNSPDHAVAMNEACAAGVMNQASSGARMAEERLPFTRRVARGDAALQNAVTIRRTAYGRNVSEFAAKLSSPEPKDHDQGSVVLLAESGLDGSPLGTTRIQTYRHRDLAIEQWVELPAWPTNRSTGEATRLGIDLAGPDGSSGSRCSRQSIFTAPKRTSKGAAGAGLEGGARTADICELCGSPVSCSEMGAVVLQELARLDQHGPLRGGFRELILEVQTTRAYNS